MTIYIATSNPGKLRDFAAADTLHIPIAPLPNLTSVPPGAEWRRCCCSCRLLCEQQQPRRRRRFVAT